MIRSRYPFNFRFPPLLTGILCGILVCSSTVSAQGIVRPARRDPFGFGEPEPKPEPEEKLPELKEADAFNIEIVFKDGSTVRGVATNSEMDMTMLGTSFSIPLHRVAWMARTPDTDSGWSIALTNKDSLSASVKDGNNVVFENPLGAKTVEVKTIHSVERMQEDWKPGLKNRPPQIHPTKQTALLPKGDTDTNTSELNLLFHNGSTMKAMTTDVTWRVGSHFGPQEVSLVDIVGLRSSADQQDWMLKSSYGDRLMDVSLPGELTVESFLGPVPLKPDLLKSIGVINRNRKASAEFRGKGYIVIEQTTDVFTASKEARLLGGHLVIIDDEAENTFVQNLAKEYGLGGIWLGASDAREERNWKWFDGRKMSYENWNRGEPNGRHEDYIMLFSSNGTWNDIPGTSTMAAVVELDDEADLVDLIPDQR